MIVCLGPRASSQFTGRAALWDPTGPHDGFLVQTGLALEPEPSVERGHSATFSRDSRLRAAG